MLGGGPKALTLGRPCNLFNNAPLPLWLARFDASEANMTSPITLPANKTDHLDQSYASLADATARVGEAKAPLFLATLALQLSDFFDRLIVEARSGDPAVAVDD